ncbi:MAG: gamma-mobile-trio protein GmtX [bacterium]|nr:gamma-mobile-trio protein GmtX [bacterium]
MKPDSNVTTYYPLHSLRVSLITAYAVPMPILSKAIAGHARLVMTLYYIKAGISYVTDKMNQAEKSILENDKEAFNRFIRDAKYEQLETSVAANDPIAYQAVINAQKSGASIVISDKGICPKGCFGCDSGGTYDYRTLISQWAEYYKTTTKKPKKERASTVNDDILSSITDSTTRVLVGMLISDNKKLKRENSLLKEQTTLTIDMRPMNDSKGNKDVVIVEPSYNLTDSEIDALRNAISDEFMNHQGWTTDNYGRVKENGIQVYKAGYRTAIQKILDLC